MVLVLGAAASWAFYILASARVGAAFPKLDGLALAMTAGALVALPFGIADAGAALLRPEILGLGAAVAVLSSTLPYAFELIALRRLAASAFAILMSLAPATASLAGFVLLGQQLNLLELAGVALVIAASIGAVRAAGRHAREAVEPVGSAEVPAPLVSAGSPEPAALTVDGTLLRDAELDRYLQAHHQFGGDATLGQPAGFLRSATYVPVGR
mgnify:CR=1 FL=1